MEKTQDEGFFSQFLAENIEKGQSAKECLINKRISIRINVRTSGLERVMDLLERTLGNR